MHKFVRCAYCKEMPKSVDPPLLYNVEHDPGEKWPLDISKYLNYYMLLEAEFSRYNATIYPREPLLDSKRIFAAPCCSTIPENRPCVCNESEILLTWSMPHHRLLEFSNLKSTNVPHSMDDSENFLSSFSKTQAVKVLSALFLNATLDDEEENQQ